MFNLFNPGVVNGAQGGGVQDGQCAGGLGDVHHRVGAHQKTGGEEGLWGYHGGGEGNARGGEVHHHHSGGKERGQRDGLHHARVVGRQGGDEEVTHKMDERKQTPIGMLKPGSRRKAIPKRKMKESERGLVQGKITSFIRLFPNLDSNGTKFKNKNGDLKSTPSLKRKVSLDSEGEISPAKRMCKD